MALSRIARRQRIHYRIRKHVSGTPERPRMVVFRSNKQIYVQVIDDEAGITTISFDRGGYLFHGRVKSLADAAREGGLIF